MGWDKPIKDDRPTMHGSRAGRSRNKWAGEVMRLKAKNHSPQTSKGPKGGKKK
jgi:hypothetical protein